MFFSCNLGNIESGEERHFWNQTGSESKVSLVYMFCLFVWIHFNFRVVFYQHHRLLLGSNEGKLSLIV